MCHSSYISSAAVPAQCSRTPLAVLEHPTAYALHLSYLVEARVEEITRALFSTLVNFVLLQRQWTNGRGREWEGGGQPMSVKGMVLPLMPLALARL